MNRADKSEGVIKYQLDFTAGKAPWQDIRALNVWRSILFELGLIGQDPQRYQGYGFGNLSQRCHNNPRHFIISGTQTGHLPTLQRHHYVEVCGFDIECNRLQACGPLKPSSEALTHAMLYRLDESIQCVIHVHAPILWRYGLAQQYPATAATVEYGTPAMARAIEQLYRSGELAQARCLMMAGHEDGVICFGDSIEQAALALLKLWVAATVSSARAHQ